jgi:hypothetical protein
MRLKIHALPGRESLFVSEDGPAFHFDARGDAAQAVCPRRSAETGKPKDPTGTIGALRSATVLSRNRRTQSAKIVSACSCCA